MVLVAATSARIAMGDPQFEHRRAQPYSPPSVKYSDLQAAVPTKLRSKSLLRSLGYVARDTVFAIIFYRLALLIDINPIFAKSPIRIMLWLAYWFWQGVVFTGFWTLAHEAGHRNLSEYNVANGVIGLILHSFLLVPHFAWSHTHYLHHKNTNSMEKDENYVPSTRSELGLPPVEKATKVDYEELLEEAPLFVLGRLILMQTIGLPSYLAFNVMGSRAYPKWTSHFSPLSPLFRPKDRWLIVISDIGVASMAYLLFRWTAIVGLPNLVKLYFVPYLMANHWVVMLTYLQHSDPTVPHFRSGEWTWLRGALATVDRPLLGWIGRFFFHNISHDHVAHHLFPHVPFYSLPEVTEAIKPVLKDDYYYDGTNTFYALYRSFSQCIFVEDSGGILFYKDRKGQASRAVYTES